MDIDTQVFGYIVSILLGIITAYPGIKALKAQRVIQREQLEADEAEREARVKKIEDEITERVVARANSEIANLTVKLDVTIKKVEELEKENETLRKENIQLKREITILKNKYKENNND